MSDDPTLRNRLRDAGTDPTEEFRARLRHRLEHELAGTTVVEPAVSTSAPPPRRTWRWIASAAAVVTVLVGVVVLRSPDDTAAPPDTTTTNTTNTTADSTTDSTSAPTAPTTTATASVSDEALLAALTGSTWILTDADGRPIPFRVPYLAPLPPGADGLVSTFDGCNGGSIRGVIEDGRLRITEAMSTAIGCPDRETLALPSESSLTLTDDGRTLIVTALAGTGPTLTFRRDDALGTAVQRDQLVGWWTAGDADAASFGADGTLTAGACTQTWRLDASGLLYVYESLSAPDASCPLRLLAAMANGPFTALRDDTGALWLLGLDRLTVLRLEPTDEPAPEPIIRPFPTIELAPRLFPIDDLEPCEPGRCPSLAVAPDGTIVSYDAAEHTITVGRRGDVPARTVPVDGPAPATGFLVGIGPDDVAYLVVQPADAVDPVGDVIAVPLSGPDAGRIVARADAVADLSGDSRLVATSDGWVAVGCCGPEPVLPVPGQTPALGWVDRTGAPAAYDGPLFSMERPGDIVLVRTDAEGTRSTWTIPADEMYLMAGIPLAAMADDGSTIVSWMGFREQRHRLLRLRADGGIEEILVPPGLTVVALSPFGAAIVYDGAAFQTWQLPAFTSPTDATATATELAGPGPFATPEDLVDRLLRALSAPDDCEVAPSATVIARSETPDLVVTIAARSGCDDSGAGSDITLTLTQDADGSWFVASAEQRGLCSRGASGDLCI